LQQDVASALPVELELRIVATQIVRRLRNRGFTSYFAGGCVRDNLRGVAPKDIDIVTSALPEDIQSIFSKTIPVGIQFGVVRVLEGGFEFEVATFRSDGHYSDGRHPDTVAFSSPEEDAKRRDFTVNGLFYDPIENQVIDYVGGKTDLKARLLKAIGNPNERFDEDKLRLLRTIRFAAVLDFDIDSQTWEAVKARAQDIHRVSPERIREELLKMFSDPHRVRAFDLLDSSGLLAELLPEVATLKGCEQPAQFHPEGDVFVHTRKMLTLLGPEADGLLVFSVLLHDIGKPPTQTFDPINQRIRFNGHDRVGAQMAEKIMNRLRFSREATDTVVEAVQNHMIFKDVQEMRPAKLRRFMARSHFDLEIELHRVDCASSHGDLGNLDFLKAKQAEFAAEPLIPPPLIRGSDLITLGLTPGPIFGEILEGIQTAQLESTIHTKDEALKMVEALRSKWENRK
jgi:putative nucleotidyltransferase with HDIG domain